MNDLLGPNIAPIVAGIIPTVQETFEAMSVEVLAAVLLTGFIIFAAVGTNILFPRKW